MHKLLQRQLRKAVKPDGTVDVPRLCELVSSAYDDADARGRLNDHALQVLQDELEAANARMRAEAEARFAVVMDNVGEAVVIINEQGIIEAFNKAAEQIFGYAAAEVVGGPVTILMTEAHAVRHDGYLEHYRRTGERRIIGSAREVTGLRRNGEEFAIDLAVGEVFGDNRTRYIGVLRDVSQRKRIERELRESETRFRDLAGSASDWFWETDSDYRLSFVSDRIAAVLGVRPSAILGATFFELGLEEESPALAAKHRRTIADRDTFRDIVFHVGPEEGTDSRIIRISGIPVFNDSGAFSGYRGIGVDITREAAAERRAHQAQQQLSDAIESIVDAIAVYDSSDRLVISNSFYRMLFKGDETFLHPGTSFAQVLRRLLDDNVFDTEGLTRDQWFESRMALHREATGKAFVNRMVDGRWILSREYRTRDGGVVGVRTDITELKRREDELDGLRRRYQLILDSAGEGIIGVGRAGRIIFVNRMACDLLGIESEDVIGACFHAFVQPYGRDGELYPFDQAAVRRAYRDGIAEQISNDIFWRFDGTPLAVDYLVAPIQEQDRITGAVVVFRDASLRLRYERGIAEQQRELERLVAERTAELTHEVSIRAKTEAALRASRERLKIIADSLFEAVLVIDRSGQVSFANASARQLLEWDMSDGDIEGHPLDGLMLLRRNDGFIDFAHSPWLQAVIVGETFQDDDAVFTTSSGRDLTVAYACSPIKEDEAVRGAILSFRDIQALKEAQREALHSSRLATVGQLAAGIAHEINTPIQYIGDNLQFIGTSLAKLVTVIDAARADGCPGFEAAASMVKLPFLMGELPASVEESLDGVAQIARIVLSMKEFSHPGTTAKTLTDLNRAIESTLTVSRNTWKHVAEVETNLAPTLPPVLCLAGEMNQVFLNLVVNAAHAIEDSGKHLPGTITISTEQIDDQVEIRVADSGVGVPDTLRDRIFDPFFTTKEVGKGTGQGLAICRDVIVTKHGGRIYVDGGGDKGAVFVIRLPINSDAATDEG
jgi:PAS domain S-box-containing protein